MALRAFTLFCFSPQAMSRNSCCFRGPVLLWCCAHVHVWTSTLFWGVERCHFWYAWFPLCSGDGPFRLVTGLTRPDTRSEDRAFLDQIEQKMKVRRRRTTPGRPGGRFTAVAPQWCDGSSVGGPREGVRLKLLVGEHGQILVFSVQAFLAGCLRWYL